MGTRSEGEPLGDCNFRFLPKQFEVQELSKWDTKLPSKCFCIGGLVSLVVSHFPKLTIRGHLNGLARRAWICRFW